MEPAQWSQGHTEGGFQGFQETPIEIVNIASKRHGHSVCLQPQNEHKYMKTYIMMADFCRGVHSLSPKNRDTLIEQSVKYSNRTVIRSIYFLVENLFEKS